MSMITVTIGVGEKYELLAKLAAESCRRRTGLETRILGAEAVQRYGVAHPHHLKFKLFDEFPDVETILYFDADTIFVKPFDFRQFENLPELICVADLADKGWVIQDARRVGIPPAEYFNSGFLILNRTHHRPMLAEAEALLATLKSPFKDQTQLNAARVQLRIPVRWLPKEFNFLDFHHCKKPDGVVVGHMHGMANQPVESIRRFYQFWANPVGTFVNELGRGDAILRRLASCQAPAGAEIGVLAGRLSAYLLGARPDLSLIMVDAWTAVPPDSRYAQSGDTVPRLKQSDFDRAYATAVATTTFASDRRMVVRALSAVTARRIANHNLDFVFLDADHTYEGVRDDIEAWLPKLKPGGWLCGHDFEFPGRPRWGVRKAVEEIAAKLALPYERDRDNTWFIRIPSA